MSKLEHEWQISLAAITISGSDARPFLQSQLTLDVENIGEGQLQPGAWCSPNGRVDVVLLVSVDRQRATLVLPETMAETVFRRARMYSIGRQVDIAYGPEVREGESAPGNEARSLALALDRTRRLVVARDASATSKADAWTLPVDWLRRDIDCGMPWILPETTGLFLPQMLGLEQLGGLSYRKGCFPGQEVIARVHYRGRVTRKIARFRLRTDRPPPPGTAFELAEAPACVLYGTARAEADRECDGLAVVSANADADMALSINGVAGALVSC